MNLLILLNNILSDWQRRMGKMTEYLPYYIEDDDVVKNEHLHNFRIRCLTPEDAEYCCNQLNVDSIWTSYYFKEMDKLKQENEELKKENYKLHKRLGDFEPFEKYIKERTSKILSVNDIIKTDEPTNSVELKKELYK